MEGSRSGLALLEAEMLRQHDDAALSIRSNTRAAARLAGSIVRTNGLLLIGMGASHYANRVAEVEFRKLGIDCWALTAAEYIQSPPTGTRTRLLVSQSGESGEIVEMLDAGADDHSFGITLDPDSTLGRALPCLVGSGGGEVAFAATRSLLVTLALLSAPLPALGSCNAEVIEAVEAKAVPSVDAALAALGGKASIVVSGEGALRGLAEANALMLMELARMPALGLGHAAFRHGPLELLSPEVGVLLLRGPGVEGAAVPGLARTALAAGSTPVVFDCSGEPALPDTVTVAFPPSRGLAAAVLMLPALQQLLIGVAAGKVERVGEPLRSTKITRADA